MSIDAAKNAFDLFVVEWEENSHAIETEQDARFQIINKMLSSVLGWSDNQIRTEPYDGNGGYVDYLLSESGRNRLVVEAKRQSVLLINTVSSRKSAYKVGGAALKNAREGLQQASNYCMNSGAPFLVLTNGFEWIGHWPGRGDGRDVGEYSAIVFPNHKSIQDNFAEFFDLFSREGIRQDLFKIIIRESEGLALNYSEPLRELRDPKDLRRLKRNALARDVSDVLEEFFSHMSGDNDLEMLSECFVESKDSLEAESSLQRIASGLLQEIENLGANSSHLQEEIRGAVERERKEFVLIVGSKGAGKSTFIDRFFRSILDPDLRKRCTLLKVDLKSASGSLEEIASWLTSRLIVIIERALFDNDVLTYEQLQGVFHSQYQRWSQGEFRHLYESDKIAFKIKFGEYVYAMRQISPNEYLQAFLAHAVFARKLMPCLIFDNTDHFSQKFQESVFQYAQSIHRNVYSFVICPITDRTIWQLSKHGPFQSYDTKAFYLPTPSTKEVLQKRVNFLNKKLTASNHHREDYFLNKGIRLSIKDIGGFTACVEEVFINIEYVSRAVSWLCNHDIRRGLQLSKQIITSPHIAVDDLVKTYLTSRTVIIPRGKIKKALFLGEYNQFTQESSEFVMNLFTIFPDMVGSPLTKISILQCLKDKSSSASDADSDNVYMEVVEVAAYLEIIGIPIKSCKKHLQQLLDYRLVEPYDPTEAKSDDAVRLKISSSGLMHLEFALTDPSYIEHVGLGVAVREEARADEIRAYLKVRPKTSVQADIENWWGRLRHLFAEYVLGQDLQFCSIPPQYSGQRTVREQFRSKWVER